MQTSSKSKQNFSPTYVNKFFLNSRPSRLQKHMSINYLAQDVWYMTPILLWRIKDWIFDNRLAYKSCLNFLKIVDVLLHTVMVLGFTKVTILHMYENIYQVKIKNLYNKHAKSEHLLALNRLFNTSLVCSQMKVSSPLLTFSCKQFYLFFWISKFY